MIIQIIILIILAFILRTLFIFDGAVSFHYDMARDAFMALQIWSEGNLKILGPPTSTPGLFHGPLYYYLLAPLYGLGKGDPRIVAIIFSFINSLTVIPIMLLARDLFKSLKFAFLAGLLFAISFEATQYGPWLSNPSPAYLTIALFFYFLRVWQKGNSIGLYLATLSAALSAQFQFFLIYLFVLIPIFGYIFNLKVKFTSLLKTCVIAILGLSSFMFAAVKFQTTKVIIGGFISIAASGQIDFRSSFSQTFIKFLDKYSELFIYNFFPTSVALGGLLSIAVLVFLKKEKLILFFLFSNLGIFIFGGHSNTYANVGLATPAILAVVNMIKIITRWNKFAVTLLIFFIIASNLYAIFKNGPLGQLILVIPNDMVLKNQLALIDLTYHKAEGQPFSINTLTLPLWINITWAYLYFWYGQEKYGYLPKFYGHDQVGLLGVEVLEKIVKPLEKTFFIIEPHVGIPDDIYNLEISSEDSKTEIVETMRWGDLRLQYRKPIINEK